MPALFYVTTLFSHYGCRNFISSNRFFFFRTFLCGRDGLTNKNWRPETITHPIQIDDVSCAVYVLKVNKTD